MRCCPAVLQSNHSCSFLSWYCSCMKVERSAGCTIVGWAPEKKERAIRFGNLSAKSINDLFVWGLCPVNLPYRKLCFFWVFFNCA